MFNTSRRGFLQGVAGLSALGLSGVCGAAARKPSGKIRLAAVGVMGKGFSDWMPMVKSGLAELVAWCDADAGMREAAINHKDTKKVPGLSEALAKIPFYQDYRKMLDDQSKLQIDAMTVSTPDHMHAPIAIRAMKQGTHVYVQKPLVRTLWELDYFKKTAKEYGVVTQMGNQGSGTAGLRRGVDELQSGILGDVKEVHGWTTRPVWPQGKGAAEATLGAADPIPGNLNWDAWIGTAKMRNFKGAYKPGKKGYDPWNICHNVYHAFSWRGFIDFGCGAFGDMACHTMNLPFRGLELGAVTKAECVMIEDKNDIAFPMKSTVKLTYAARDSQARPGAKLPEVTLFWYDGCVKPSADLMPQVIAKDGKVPDTGCLVIGTKGILCSTNDYGGESFIALKGEKAVQNVNDHEACKAIAVTIPRCGGASGGMDKSSGAASLSADGHYIEFLHAINGNGPVFRETHSRCYADVDFSIPIMEGILCGTIAQQVAGELKWCAKTQQFDNAAANALLKPYIRTGFEF